MEIPYYIFGIPYLLALFFFSMRFFFNLYHIIKFGFFDFSGKMNTFFFVALTIVLLWITILLLKNVPWLDTFTLDTLFSSDLLTNRTADFSL
ncbi:MAG: hypothetical protein HYV32_03845 [Candidatus Kerfeldbacteria bacterium]|nr:hypothetical protein [Candidatus Kerfeldbacteria bacterium]